MRVCVMCVYYLSFIWFLCDAYGILFQDVCHVYAVISRVYDGRIVCYSQSHVICVLCPVYYVLCHVPYVPCYVYHVLVCDVFCHFVLWQMYDVRCFTRAARASTGICMDVSSEVTIGPYRP